MRIESNLLLTLYNRQTIVCPEISAFEQLLNRI